VNTLVEALWQVMPGVKLKTSQITIRLLRKLIVTLFEVPTITEAINVLVNLMRTPSRIYDKLSDTRNKKQARVSLFFD